MGCTESKAGAQPHVKQAMQQGQRPVARKEGGMRPAQRQMSGPPIPYHRARSGLSDVKDQSLQRRLSSSLESSNGVTDNSNPVPNSNKTRSLTIAPLDVELSLNSSGNTTSSAVGNSQGPGKHAFTPQYHKKGMMDNNPSSDSLPVPVPRAAVRRDRAATTVNQNGPPTATAAAVPAKRSRAFTPSPKHAKDRAAFSPPEESLNRESNGVNKGVPEEMDQYKVTGYLGRGTWAVVHECRDKRNGTKYAVKTFDKRKISTYDLFHSGKREARLLKKLFVTGETHPNICTLVEVLESRQWYHMIVVLGGRELQQMLDEKAMAEDRARSLFRDLLTAMAFIHAKGVCHRDIKPSNLLVTDRLMVTDFGLGDMATKGDDPRALNEICGTPDYIAPEVLTARTYEGTKVDMWSCGITLFAMLTGKTPWVGSSKNYKMKQIKEGNYLNAQAKNALAKLSPEANDMITQLLQVKADRRIDAEQALRHPWCRGVKLPANHSRSTVLSL